MGYEPKWLQAIRKSKGGPRLIAKYQRPPDSDVGERLPDFLHATGNEYFRLDVAKPRAYVRCVGLAGRGVHVWDPLTDACARCGRTRAQYMASSPFPAPAMAVGYPMERVSDAQPPSDQCVPVTWWYCDPLGHWGMLAAPMVAEHMDGTISVRGTINNHGPYEPWWRGTLLSGVWSGHVISTEASQAVE